MGVASSSPSSDVLKVSIIAWWSMVEEGSVEEFEFSLLNILSRVTAPVNL